MGKTILRVLDGTVLSAALTSTLKELLPDFEIEFFKPKPDYKDNIRRRIQSLHAAFLFILEAYPLDTQFTNISKQTLVAFANEAMAGCNLDKTNLDDLHKELERFTGSLVSVLNLNWKWPRDAKESAIACLNEAEQYLLMSKGRPNTATLTVLDFGSGSEYLLQIDETLHAYYDKLLVELKQLKESNFPAAPSWFLGIKAEEQAYLCNQESLVTPEHLIEDLKSFTELISKVKKTALNWELDLEQIQKQKLPYPGWFNRLHKAKQEYVRISAAASTNLELALAEFTVFLIEKSTNAHFEKELKISVQLPQWYLLLPNYQQAFLKHIINQAKKIEDVVTFLPSRHRTLPAPANFAAHQIVRINNEGVTQVLSDKRYRSSHIVSRDLLRLKTPEAIHLRHSDSNLEQVLRYAKKDQEIILQTLISPLKGLEILDSVALLIPDLPPDSKLYQQARAAVTRSPHALRIVQPNHPLNVAKRFYPTYAGDKDSLYLIKKTEDLISLINLSKKRISDIKLELSSLVEKAHTNLEVHINALKEEISDLEAKLPSFHEQSDTLSFLVEEYSELLNSSPGSATVFDYNGRELFLSSLEQLIMLTQEGYSYGSCVSGKDRKALELIHTDAMLIYKVQYKAWPKFTDSGLVRERFIALVSHLYVSRHQHELAGQNAPGSEGIKTPDRYLPQDICDEINRRFGSAEALKNDNRLATDNEVKNIFMSLEGILIPTAALRALLVARQLGEDRCTQLYDALHALVNEKHLFHVPKSTEWVRSLNILRSESSALPTGIEAIRKLMHDEGSGNTNMQRLVKIIQIVLERPLDAGTRKPATIEVYDGILGFFQHKISPSLAEYAIQVTKKWRARFEMAKAENSGLMISDEESTSPCSK